MKKIGFLSFGHWTPSPQSQTRSAADTLLQSIELAVAAEQLGADGAYFRVHHFARQLASPFPLLAAVGARTSTIEIGTAVIDMRYENPLYMIEDAGSADLIAGGRLQLGISPRLAGAGDRRLALLWLSPGRRPERCRHGPAPCGGLSGPVARRRFCRAQSATDVSQSAGAAAPRTACGGPSRTDLVGRRLERDRGVGSEARHESAELDAEERRDRRSFSCAAGGANPELSRRVDGGRPRPRAPRVRQPQHLRADE
ncbi:hypothetical protein ACVWXN_009327 [Bradyrhizobium sp. i1.4.4]